MAFFTAASAFFLQPLGGLRSPSTSWSLYSTSCAFLIWTMLFWSVDIRGWKKGLGPLRTIGKNSLLLYQLSRYWIFLYWLAGLTFYDKLGENTASGIVRAMAYTVFLGVITVMASKKRVLLRV